MKKLAAALLIATCALTAASAKVTTDSSPSASFAQYKTYYWAMQPQAGSPLMQQRIVDGIDARLQAKGWTKAADKGDVAVAAHVTTDEKKSLDTFYTGSALGRWGWRGWGGAVGMGSATTTVHTYDTGTLVVDMFDAASQQAIWRGTATETISSSPDKVARELDKDLDKMFEKFPPGPSAG